jgi:hypothetical protein
MKRDLSVPFYPEVYHRACNHLVAFGAHGGDTNKGRMLIARALMALRARHGRQSAQHHRRHMLFISGMFPVKR